MHKLSQESFRVRWLQLTRGVPKDWATYELDEQDRYRYLAFYVDMPLGSGFGTREEIGRWLTKHCPNTFKSVEGNISGTKWYFCFKNESDATLFKMSC